MTAWEARNKKSTATSSRRPKSATTSSGSKSAKVVRAAARPVKPVNELLKEMHSDGIMFVPKFYRDPEEP